VTSLRDTQQLFWRLISAPEGVASGLRQIDMKSDELERLLGGDARLDAVERLDIYANMYFFRLLDILRGDFEALLAVVGDDAFHNLVTDYLVACPSQHPSVRNVGARLPGFVAAHALASERPWLGELAALERARVELFDGPDAAPLTLDELRALPPDQFVRLPLPLVPSHLFVEAGFAVDEVWRAVEEKAELRPPAPEPRTLLVWRHQLVVYHRPLEPLEREALARAQKGAPFGVVCDLLSERLPVEEAAPAAFRMLARWVGDGLIARA
jgi:putative DNA-binding protein